MRQIVSVLLPLLGLALFAFIVFNTGFDRIVDVFRTADTALLVWLPVLLAAIIIVRGLRWQYLLNSVGIKYSLGRSIVVWVIAYFVASVTPGKVGDAVRAIYVRRDTGASFGVAFLTVFIDRLWDLVMILVAGVVTVLVFSQRYTEIPSQWVFVASLLAAGAGLYFVFNRSLVRAVVKPLFSIIVPEKYHDKFSLSFHDFYDALSTYGRSFRHNAITGLLTLVYWVLVFGLGHYVCLVLNIPVPWYYTFLIMPIITLVELIPISVSGLGTREATAIYFFSVIGLVQAQAVGFSIGYLIAGTYLTALVGFFLWLRHPVKFSSEE